MDSDNPWGLPPSSSPLNSTTPKADHIGVSVGPIAEELEGGVRNGDAGGDDDDVVEEEGRWDEMQTLGQEKEMVERDSMERETLESEGGKDRNAVLHNHASTRVDDLEVAIPPSSSITHVSSSIVTVKLPEAESEAPLAAEEEEDDFADFGDPFNPTSGSDDEFGSFDNSSFDLPTFSPPLSIPIITRQEPIASTSAIKYSSLDLGRVDQESLREGLVPFLRGMYAGFGEGLSDEMERSVEGVGQVLVSDNLRGLLSNLSSLPALRPLDWRRSRIRREHLIALGVPINLDDSPDAKPLASLILPSQLIARPGTPSSTYSSTSPQTYHSSPLPSRSSTPRAFSPHRSHPPARAISPPPLDTARAGVVCGIEEGDLKLMGLGELERLKREMEGFKDDASLALESALERREKEVGDGETYHRMIQDLVSAASKMKMASSKNSGSGKWGRKNTGGGSGSGSVR